MWYLKVKSSFAKSRRKNTDDRKTANSNFTPYYTICLTIGLTSQPLTVYLWRLAERLRCQRLFIVLEFGHSACYRRCLLRSLIKGLRKNFPSYAIVRVWPRASAEKLPGGVWGGGGGRGTEKQDRNSNTSENPGRARWRV